MATLVLTAAGTALGGPVGGAIGSLIGQSIDQQILGSRARGPRLGDLAVQTSSYGTLIPRIYGRMRVAGSVVWATDLNESSTQAGAKGQPDTTVYSYSVSLAVALSSRPIRSVRRVWADGKLLRGEAGDLKVKTGFRVLTGSEEQVVDPLIASIEGVDRTPAYRGLAMAVFEDLQLAEFGNRIPFLTFEVEADAPGPTAGAVVSDASGGSIQASDPTVLVGYAAHGPSIEAAVAPLVDRLAIPLLDDGAGLRSPVEQAALTISEDFLGCAPGSEGAGRSERTQVRATALPNALTLSYFDPARDYQAGQMRAATGTAEGPQRAVELAAVLEAGTARAIAESELARSWARRDRLTVRLAPALASLLPGSIIRLNGESGRWQVDRMLFEAMIPVCELSRACRTVPEASADPGRALPGLDRIRQPTSLQLFELPSSGIEPDATIVVHLAASSAEAGHRQVPVELAAGGQGWSVQTALVEAVMGEARTGLPDGPVEIMDSIHAVEIELLNDEQWLESRDDEALAMGANLAMLGEELIQFGRAVPIGPRRFRLDRLLRGRRGSEWAMGTHAIGEAFVLLSEPALRRLELPLDLRGAVLKATPDGVADVGTEPVARTLTGETLRPPSPAHLRAVRDPDGSLRVSWVRRSRSGWAWLDEIEVPLGEAQELFSVAIAGPSGDIARNSTGGELIVPAANLAALGMGSATVTVRQMGDFAASQPATIAIQLS